MSGYLDITMICHGLYSDFRGRDWALLAHFAVESARAQRL